MSAPVNFGNDRARLRKAVAATRRCSICGRDVRASSLEPHENRHRVEAETKPCEQCGKAIQRKSNYGLRQWTAQRCCSDGCRARHTGVSARIPLSDSYVVRDNGCWDWTRTVDARGYGKARRRDKRASTGAHRFVWMELVGPIPEGLTLDHLCRNTRCVNPAHLEPVTLGENIRRAVAMRTQCPSGHPLDGRRSSGARYCLTCHREQQQRYLTKTREAVRVLTA